MTPSWVGFTDVDPLIPAVPVIFNPGPETLQFTVPQPEGKGLIVGETRHETLADWPSVIVSGFTKIPEEEPGLTGAPVIVNSASLVSATGLVPAR